ncbi:MAG TPA: metalloregulator ArsR/SmtB family transcription factor [Rhizomicrobium sp.]|nr:metalloregulator ArsR/SmtB family transcription factor [Rhizomicrobium sp.]
MTALGDPTRRRIFDRLRVGPGSVAALAAGLPVSRPAVSQHLKVLKEAGLVTDEAIGARRIYRAAPSGLAALRAWLDDVWEQVFAAHQAEIQRQIEERKNT